MINRLFIKIEYYLFLEMEYRKITVGCHAKLNDMNL